MQQRERQRIRTSPERVFHQSLLQYPSSIVLDCFLPVLLVPVITRAIIENDSTLYTSSDLVFYFSIADSRCMYVSILFSCLLIVYVVVFVRLGNVSSMMDMIALMMPMFGSEEQSANLRSARETDLLRKPDETDQWDRIKTMGASFGKCKSHRIGNRRIKRSADHSSRMKRKGTCCYQARPDKYGDRRIYAVEPRAFCCPFLRPRRRPIRLVSPDLPICHH